MAHKSAAPDAGSHEYEGISESDTTTALPKAEYKAKQVEIKDDKRRQLGDSTVYKYYFSSIGAVSIIVMFALEIVWAFLQSFPSKSTK